MSKTQAIVPFADVAEANDVPLTVWSALTTSLYPGAKPENVVLVYNYCMARKLDPLKKPVHIVPMSVRNAITGKYEWRDIIMPGINEHRTTASRTGLMAGSADAIFGPDIEVPITTNPDVQTPNTVTVPKTATVTVHRLDKTGVPRAYTHTEYFVEAVARTKDGLINSMWMKRPHGQLAKCAEAAALRKAFSEEIGGELTAEEMAGKTIGDEGAPPPIDGDYTVVEIPIPDQPVEKKTNAKPEPTPAPAPDRGTAAPAPAPASASAPASEPAAAPAAEGANKLSIDLPAGAPLRMLRNKLLAADLSQDDFLKGFGKKVTLSNINAAFEYIKGVTDAQP